MEYKASIIIIVFNIEKYLRECVESARNQTYKNIEIILVDDGSTDGSSKICDDYARLDSRVKVIHKTNGGLVSSRKAGAESATGEFCIFIDGDDWIEPNMVEVYFSSMTSNSIDMVCSGILRDYPDHQVKEKNLLPVGMYDKSALESKVYPSMMFDRERKACFIDPSLCNKLFRTSVLKNVIKNVDSNIFYLGEDAATTYPCLLQAGSIVVIENAMYHHRILDVVSNSGYKREKVYDRLILMYNSVKRCFEESKYKDIMLPQLNGYFLHLFGVVLKEQIGLDIFSFYQCLFTEEKKEPLHFQYELDWNKIKGYKKIALWGAGRVGKDYYVQLKENAVFSGIWVDTDCEKYRNVGLPVQPVSALLSDEIDCVVIGVKNREAISSIKKELKRMGIKDKRIIEMF